MKGFYSIRQHADGLFYWLLFANNYREITRSTRGYNQASHARDAAKRFKKIAGGSDVSYRYGRPLKVRVMTANIVHGRFAGR